MKQIYVTYTRHLYNGGTARFGVECRSMDEVNDVREILKKRERINNIRINKTGRGLPESACVFFYAEFKYNY